MKVVFEIAEHRLSNPSFTINNVVTDDGRKLVTIAALFTDLGITVPAFLTYEGEFVPTLKEETHPADNMAAVAVETPEVSPA